MPSYFPLQRSLYAALLMSIYAPINLEGAAQTWVSATTGVDATNPISCGFGDPCLTIPFAVQFTRPGGELDVLVTGEYSGADSVGNPGTTTLINQAITIDGGEGNIASIFNQFFTVNAPGSVVILRNLEFNGYGNQTSAVQYQDGDLLIIENCKFYGYTEAAVDMSGGTQLVIRDCWFENNNIGILLETGLVGSMASISNVSLKGNTSVGLEVDAGVADISNSIITQNAIGLVSSHGSTLNCINNVLTSNTSSAIEVGDGGFLTISNNDIYNNGAFIVYAPFGNPSNVATANNNRVGNNGAIPGAPTQSITIQ